MGTVALREVEHHGIEPVAAQGLEQVLLVEQGVELVPGHGVVQFESLDDDGGVLDRGVARGQIDERLAVPYCPWYGMVAVTCSVSSGEGVARAATSSVKRASPSEPSARVTRAASVRSPVVA